MTRIRRAAPWFLLSALFFTLCLCAGPFTAGGGNPTGQGDSWVLPSDSGSPVESWQDESIQDDGGSWWGDWGSSGSDAGSDSGSWDWGDWDSGGSDSGSWDSGGWDSGSDSGSWDWGGSDSGSWDSGGWDSGSDSGSW